MDKLEQFIHDNRDEFDTLKATDQLWKQLDTQLDAGTKTVVNILPAWLKIAAALLVAAGLAMVILTYQSTGLDVNKTPPEIVLYSPIGEPVPLSSLKGKIVMVMFWASWSEDCKDDNCNVYLPIYEEYKSKGFEIYAVSLDTDKSQWLKGIQRDNLPWIQVSDLKGFESPVTRAYDVNDVPTTYLLNKKRKIVAKNLPPPDLELKLKELFPEKLASLRILQR